MRTPFFLVLMLWAAAAPAQTMFKCIDDNRQRTYSNIPCEKQGLKTDGTVTADRVTVMPKGDAAPLPTQKLKPPVEMPKDLEKKAK